jgi:uncharacterized YccA/Bax inhibitor family protein
MKKRILPDQLPMPGSLRKWGPRAGYGIAVGIGGALVSLLLMVVSGPRFSNVEQWEAIALGWILLGGVMLVLASIVSGLFIHHYYIQCRSGPAAVLVFSANVLVVAALALLAAAWAAGI